MKDCGKHNHKKKRRVLYIVGGIVIATGFLVLLVWIILQPKKPQFVLQDYTLGYLNLTEQNSLSSEMQITLSAKNPNQRIGIYYEKLDVYATYRHQPITLATEIPETYQDIQDIAVWSSYLYGNAVPVAPLTADLLDQDESAGALLLNLRINGRLKWKLGTWTSGTFRVDVNCPAFIRFAAKYTGIKYQVVQDCHVEVSLN